MDTTLSIAESKITTIVSGLLLTAYAVYDIYEELLDPTHEHILILIGILLVISAFGHVNEGIHKIAHNVAPNKNLHFLERVGAFFRRPIVRIVLGVTILIAAGYGLYEDYQKIHTKSVSMGIGSFTMFLPIFKVIIGGDNLKKGIKKELKETSDMK